MSAERKILIILAAIVVAFAIFGFKNQENYRGDDDYYKGGPSIAAPVEYTTTYFKPDSWSYNRDNDNSIEDHLNDMGAQGWTLASTQEGTFNGEYLFIFSRPVAKWR